MASEEYERYDEMFETRVPDNWASCQSLFDAYSMLLGLLNKD